VKEILLGKEQQYFHPDLSKDEFQSKLFDEFFSCKVCSKIPLDLQECD
jgi:hypothetical protein